MEKEMVKGRFAPSPTGRMHLGNLWCALVSWLSARSRGGTWLLRIEDLDTGRSRREWSELIEEDLKAFGLDWDEGGLEDRGAAGPYSQSRRSLIYEEQASRIRSLSYPCTCRRADILAADAPHMSDGRVVYSGKCRPARLEDTVWPDGQYATRVAVPGRVVSFVDGVYGHVSVSLAEECGDFVIRRADGGWAYQFAVVVDDALMGVTEVVRGSDLLLSTPQQIFLHETLGFASPSFCHIPLVCAEDGRRLCKRDRDMDLGELRKVYGPEEIIGYLAYAGGVLDHYEPAMPADLIPVFDRGRLPSSPVIASASSMRAVLAE